MTKKEAIIVLENERKINEVKKVLKKMSVVADYDYYNEYQHGYRDGYRDASARIEKVVS